MHIEIENHIPILSPTSTVKEAQMKFNDTSVSHLPIVENTNYLGCIASYDVKNAELADTIDQFSYTFERFFVTEDVNELEILEVISKNETNIMPVLSQAEKKYLGYVELQTVIEFFSDMPFLSEHGNILVVAKGMTDQSFSEICQIVESNNTKIFSAYISKIENDIVETTLKIGNGDFNTIIQTFRRYGYEIISDHYDDVFLSTLKERSRYFDKYLNM